MLDMFQFSFEGHVNEDLRQEEANPNWSLNFIASEYTNSETSKTWRDICESQQISTQDYCLVGLYSPDDKDDVEDSTVPRRLLHLLRPIMNAANNVTIISHFISLYSKDVEVHESRGLLVFGRILEQVFQFVTCACNSAWKLGYMKPEFIPYDMYQFLDLFEKFGVWDRRVVETAGARNTYNTHWHPSLRKHN